MAFEVSDKFKLKVKAWRAWVEIMGDVDLDAHMEVHGGDQDLIQAMDGVLVEMAGMSEVMEMEELARIDELNARLASAIPDPESVGG